MARSMFVRASFGSGLSNQPWICFFWMSLSYAAFAASRLGKSWVRCSPALPTRPNCSVTDLPESLIFQNFFTRPWTDHNSRQLMGPSLRDSCPRPECRPTPLRLVARANQPFRCSGRPTVTVTGRRSFRQPSSGGGGAGAADNLSRPGGHPTSRTSYSAAQPASYRPPRAQPITAGITAPVGTLTQVLDTVFVARDRGRRPGIACRDGRLCGSGIHREDDGPARFRSPLVEPANVQEVLPGIVEVLVPHLNLVVLLRIDLIVALPYPGLGNLGERRRDILHLGSGDVRDGVIPPAKKL